MFTLSAQLFAHHMMMPYMNMSRKYYHFVKIYAIIVIVFYLCKEGSEKIKKQSGRFV